MDRSTRIQVLLIDSDFIVRCGVVVALQREPDIEIVAQVSDEQRARDLFASSRVPDVVLLGVHSDQWTEAHHELVALELHCQSKVLVYGGDEVEEQVFGAVDAGASGYICRHTRRNLFVEAVRSVASGRRYFSGRIREMLSERQSRKELSAREMTMLHLISEGLSNKEMAAEIGVSPETVKFHVANVIEKLGARDRTHAVMLALRRGVMRLTGRSASPICGAC